MSSLILIFFKIIFELYFSDQVKSKNETKKKKTALAMKKDLQFKTTNVSDCFKINNLLPIIASIIRIIHILYYK